MSQSDSFDYTEWRKTQPWYTDGNLESFLSQAAKESETKWSAEYIQKVTRFGETPDPTFVEQPELPFTDRGEMFD